MKIQSKFDDRVRFNWGYHDARFDLKHNMDNREAIAPGTISPSGNRPLPWQDRAYCEGYHRGLESNLSSEEHSLSSWAWIEYAKTRG